MNVDARPSVHLRFRRPGMPVTGLGLVLAVGCSYQPLRLAQANLAPQAVIESGETELAVGAWARVRLDGSRSSDPEGGALTFFWHVDGGCWDTGMRPELSLPHLELWTREAGTSCSVRLTVTDPDGLTGEATATLGVVDVGARVANAVGCRQRSDDPAGFVGKGTADVPWCRLEEGMAAAREFRLVEVLLSIDLQTVSADLEIPPGLIITGRRRFPEWQDSGTPSPIALDGDSTLRLKGGAGARLFGLRIYRTEECAADCALVDAEDAAFRVEACALGADAAGGSTTSAPYQRAFGLRARSTGTPVEVTIADSEVVLPAHGSETYGLYLDGRLGPLQGRISDGYVSGETSARLGAGIRLLGTESFTIEQGQVEISALGGFGSLVAGILDGICPQVQQPGVADGCDFPGAGETCGGSRGLRLWATRVDASAGFDPAEGKYSESAVVALASFGSDDLVVHPVDVSTSGLFAIGATRAVGLWTADTRGLVVGGQSNELRLPIDAVLAFDVLPVASTAGSNYAAAWLDGVPVLDDFWGLTGYGAGSWNPSVHWVDLRAGPGQFRSGVCNAAAAWLLDTEADAEPNIADSRITVANDGGGAVDVIAGLWTVSTQGLSLARLEIGGRALNAAKMAGAHLDGVIGVHGDGSGDLELYDTRLETQVTAGSTTSTLPIAVCQYLVDTGASTLHGNTVACSTEVTAGSLTALTQVFSTGTDQLSFIGNLIGPTTSVVPPPTDAFSVVGIRDGCVAEDGTLAAPGSDDLVLARNRVLLFDVVHANTTGILVDHGANDTSGRQGRVEISSNVVRGWADGQWVGVELRRAEAYLLGNTVRGGECVRVSGVPPSCVAPLEAVAARFTGYVPDVQPQVVVANNILDPGEAGRAVAILDAGAALVFDNDEGVWQLSAPSLAVMAANLLLSPPGDPVVAFVAMVGFNVLDGSIVELTDDESLQTMQEAQGEEDLFCSSVLAGAETAFCFDGFHLNPGSPNNVALAAIVNQASTQGAFSTATDIDGEARADLDIGADEIPAGLDDCP